MLSPTLATLMTSAGESIPGGVTPIPEAAREESLAWAGLILLFPAVSAIICGLCAACRVRNRLPGWTTVIALASSFVVVCLLYGQHQAGQPTVIHLFDWINFSWGDGTFESVRANFALYVDDLSIFWMLFVTGLGTCIAFYATEYMDDDRGKGYSRFFAAMSIFLLAMCSLVLGDNLVMLYLGWEGVGLASYLLISYYYTRQSAIDAGKKAFIMNRIGDLGLAVGIWLIWYNFGTLEYDGLFQALNVYLPIADAGNLPGTEIGQPQLGWSAYLIPWFLMVGAFGKSAQFPLMTWLPD
ncbi:MAG: proton-conducting transporter membrane subunit, partial [Planctomycetota bacterium]|nr:proton-conducting transporter membrane subunit [Planctomycetota bacterium]